MQEVEMQKQMEKEMQQFSKEISKATGGASHGFCEDKNYLLGICPGSGLSWFRTISYHSAWIAFMSLFIAGVFFDEKKNP